MKRIVLTGAESTGKSTLARALAAHYGEPWSAEYVRRYVDTLEGELQAKDLEPIARGQLSLENDGAAQAQRLVLHDTNILSSIIYAQYYFDTTIDWVNDAFLQRDYRHIIEQPDHLIGLLAGLRERYSNATFDLWKTTIKAGDWHSFVNNLLETHYDPSYARSSASRPLTEIQTLSAKTLDDDDIGRLATALGTLDR